MIERACCSFQSLNKINITLNKISNIKEEEIQDIILIKNIPLQFTIKNLINIIHILSANLSNK